MEFSPDVLIMFGVIIAVVLIFLSIRLPLKSVYKGELMRIGLTFILVGLIGGGIGILLNKEYQDSSWERDVKYELAKTEVEDGKKLIFELSALMDQRWFAAHQIFWIITEGERAVDEDVWNAYMQTVTDWNRNVGTFQSRLIDFSGTDIARELLTYEDDLNNEIPTSIHYKFFRIHERLSNLKNCALGCDYQGNITKLNALIQALTDQKSRLLSDLNIELSSRKENFSKTSL